MRWVCKGCRALFVFGHAAVLHESASQGSPHYLIFHVVSIPMLSTDLAVMDAGKDAQGLCRARLVARGASRVESVHG
jgi:hypothetical protein